MLKIFIKVSVAISCLILAAILLLQLDDKLKPEVIQFMSQSKSPDKSEAYLYLLGFSSKENEDPLLIGQKFYEEIKQQQIHIGTNQKTLQYIDVEQYSHLTLPRSQLLCPYKEENCFNDIFNHIEQIPSFVNEHHLFIQRYLAFSAFTKFHTLSKPHITTPLPPYQHLVTAVRLMSLKQIFNAEYEETEAALQALYQLHQQLRSQLALQDTLLGKFIFLNLVSENIDLISILMTRHQLQLPKPILSLTKQERSFSSGFSREVRMMYSLYQSLDGATDILDMENIDNKQSAFTIPSWLTYALFKVNITTNESYKPLHYYAILSELPIDEFNQKMRNKAHELEIENHWIRNSIGTILNQVASPDYTRYIGDSWDLENKIQLFNARLGQTSATDVISKIKNKYPIPAISAPYLSQNGHKLCFENPFNKHAKYNCLRIDY